MYLRMILRYFVDSFVPTLSMTRRYVSSVAVLRPLNLTYVSGLPTTKLKSCVAPVIAAVDMKV